MSDIVLVNSVFPSSVKVPPHGQLYLTAALEEAGFSVDLRDYQQVSAGAPWDPATLARFAAGDSPVVGISAMSYALPLVMAAARLIKQATPDRVLVAGGIGPSPVARELLAACPDLDVIVVGEGERTLVELMRALLSGAALDGVAGIVYRRDGAIYQTRPRERVARLDELPRPAYHRVDFTRYRIVDVQYGRGCPYDCTFCDIAPYWGRKHTRRPVGHFLDELEALHHRGARDLFVVDDTFVLSRAHVRDICDGIRARGLDIKWGCYARVDLMDEELMEMMAAAGCTKVFYGIEVGSDSLLQTIEKQVSRAQNHDIVRRSLHHFPFVTTSFIWGLPTETLADLEETAALLLYFAALGACPQLNLALPYSYSHLYRQYRNELRFCPQYSSQLGFYEADREWAEALIASSSHLFSAFYQVPTPDFEAKWEYLDRIGLNPHALQEAYFDHPAS